MFGNKKLKNEVEFTLDIAKKGAWENAPVLVDKDPNDYRVCMYCQFPLDHRYFVEETKGKQKEISWTIDIINLKKPSNDPKNLLAVHNNCFGNRKSDNETKRLKRYQKTKWMFPKG